MSIILTRRSLSFVILLLIGFLPARAQLIVTSAVTDSVVIQNFLGPGVTAWNRSYTGATPARGLFNCNGGCNVGLQNGILITSGAVTNAPGINTNTGSGTDNPTGPDLNLNALAPGTSNPQDAAVIRFNFRVAADSVNFDYVWASEEYHDYVGSNCNDVFGFFISGPLITGTKNIALIPGTSTPIAINTVNNGFASPWPAAGTGPCTNCQYFVNNTPSNFVQYDAFTTVLTAKEKVCPCEDYTFKMGVQDFCDGIFDSGVFLKGNSFKPTGEIPLLDSLGNELTADTLLICPGDSVKLSVFGCRAPLWTTGDTTMSIWADTTGLYAAAITNYSPPSACFAFTKSFFVILASPVAVLTTNGPTSICPNDSVQISAPAGGASYLWNTGATTSNILAGAAGDYFCTVSYSNGCIATSDTVTVTLNSGQTVSINASGPLNFCQGDSVTLTATSPTVIWSTGAVSQSITVTTPGNYVVIPNAAGFCPGTADSVTVTVSPIPNVSISGNLNICQGATTTLNATSGFSQYVWSGGQNTASISVGSSGAYAVTATDLNGCTDRDTVQVNLLPTASTAINGTFSFCQGAGTSLSAGAGFSTYQWSNGANTQSINVTAGGFYTVTVTSPGLCPGSISQQVVMNMNPVASIGGTTAICQGANANLIASPAGLTYQWSTGSGSASIQPNTPGNYTLIVIDGNGCRDTVTQLVTVNSNPTPVVSGTPQACPGDSSLLNAGAGFSSYQWSNGATTAGIYASVAGNYAVTVTDGNNCSGTTNINFTILPFTPVTISGPVGFCSGTTANLTASAGYTTYNWSNGATSQVLNTVTGGTYTVTVSAANGCTGSESYTLAQYNLPAPVISGNASYCQGSSLNLQAGPAGLNYQWSTGAATTAITVATPGTYTLTVTDPNGCSNSTSLQITENPNPQPVIAGQFTVCSGSTAQLDATMPGIVSYQWSTGAVTPGIQASVAGIYAVTVTDANGCSGSTSQNITVNTLPIVSISGTPAFCDGDSITISAVTAGLNTFLWSNGATASSILVTNGGNYAVTVTDANNCSNSATIAITENPLPQPVLPANISLCDGQNTLLQPGTFSSYQWSDGSISATLSVNSSGSYAVTVIDANGCINTATSLVVVNPIPTPTISGPDSICDGQSALLNAGSGYVQYLWSTGASSALLPANLAGSYTVSVTDINGCQGSAFFILTVNPLPQVAISGNLDICKGESTLLQTIAGQGTYSWSNGATDPFISVNNGGNYSVTVTTAEGCTKSTGVFVNEAPLPAVSYIPERALTCDELRVNFRNTSTYAPGSSFFWNFGDGNSSRLANPSHIYATIGDYVTSLRIVTPAGCADADTMAITLFVPPLPEAEFVQSARVVSVFNSEVSFSNRSVNAERYKWSFGDGQSSEAVNPVHIFDKVGTLKIKLIAFNEVDCIDEYETNLEVVPFFIPNAFTPNNDGKNDVFFDGNAVLNVNSFDMLIFNRWGQNVYTTDSFLRPWDGLGRDGKEAPEGLYTYLIKITSIKGKYYEYAGTFSLIR